jgi:hypothetical protein
MKQYVIDELRPADHKTLKAYLDKHYGPAALGSIYWIPIGSGLLTEVQAEHRQCQPHYFALDLLPDRLACELLVRTKNSVRCSCMAYATQKQRDWLIELIDTIFKRLEIKT